MPPEPYVTIVDRYSQTICLHRSTDRHDIAIAVKPKGLREQHWLRLSPMQALAFVASVEALAEEILHDYPPPADPTPS